MNTIKIKTSVLLFFIIFLVGCSQKQPITSQSATIIFKTPSLKFYDKGFVTKYDNYIHLQIFNAGHNVLDLEIYKEKICKSTFKCMKGTAFNNKYLLNTYTNNFMYEIFNKKNVYFKDKKNKILFKIKKDK